MRYMPSAHSKLRGFTLVEVLVISPILVIVVAVMIGFFVSLTGDALMSRERNSMVFYLQSALNDIEDDISLSTDVVHQTGILPSPQGSDSNFSGTTQFESSSDTLVLERLATTDSPLSASRQLLYFADSPSPCSSPEGNDVVTYRVVYFLDGTNLTKRTLVDFGGRSVCGVSDVNSDGIYQRNSCKTTDLSLCYSRDIIVAQNISDIEFLYYQSPTSVSPSAPSTDGLASIRTTITGQKSIAGSTIEQSLSLRAARIN